jgi:peptidoglycan-associated lipoprotein
MKRTTLFSFLIVLLALTMVSTGCRKKPYGVTPLPGSGPGAGMTGGDPEGMMFPETGAGSLNESGLYDTSDLIDLGDYNGDRSAFAAYTVYFDFDSSVVKGGETAKIEAVADYLLSNPSNALQIEGHCDERGTEEYNRALGERRALAIREHLATLGVNPSIVRTISYGEDMPAVVGSDESAFAKNRRGEFILLIPKN